jgi:hypothetical protein
MIYPEFRLHSIAFAMRSIICCYMAYYELPVYSKMAACYLTFGLADLATHMYKNEHTTMRNMPFSDKLTPDFQKKIIHMQSSMQVGATLFMLGNMDTAFAPLCAIQLAAFMMTLVRKGLMDANTWHLAYNISLWINVFAYQTIRPSWVVVQIGLLFVFTRFRFHYQWNKYVAWTAIFFMYFMYDNSYLQSSFDAYIRHEWFSRVVVAIFVYRQFPMLSKMLSIIEN